MVYVNNTTIKFIYIGYYLQYLSLAELFTWKLKLLSFTTSTNVVFTGKIVVLCGILRKIYLNQFKIGKKEQVNVFGK